MWVGLAISLTILTAKNCVLFNSVQEFIEIKAWLLPMFIASINFYYILLSQIKEHRCLKNVIH